MASRINSKSLRWAYKALCDLVPACYLSLFCRAAAMARSETILSSKWWQIPCRRTTRAWPSLDRCLWQKEWLWERSNCLLSSLFPHTLLFPGRDNIPEIVTTSQWSQTPFSCLQQVAELWRAKWAWSEWSVHDSQLASPVKLRSSRPVATASNDYII